MNFFQLYSCPLVSVRVLLWIYISVRFFFRWIPMDFCPLDFYPLNFNVEFLYYCPLYSFPLVSVRIVLWIYISVRFFCPLDADGFFIRCFFIS